MSGSTVKYESPLGDSDEHIHETTEKRLVYMANQMAKFFTVQGHEKTVEGVADHIRKFWDPRMRDLIFAHLDAGGDGLEPAAAEAVALVRERQRARGR